jgi:putative salt-induced outer membrane protein YdiY
MRSLLAVFLALGVATSALAADVIELTNGDRVTGTIVELKGGTLVKQIGEKGTVTVPWTEVAAIEMANPQRVKLVSGDVIEQATFVRGPEGSVFAVSPAFAGQRPVQPEEIAGIAVAEGPVWEGAVSTLAAGTSGNSETLVLAARADLLRNTDDDRLEFYGRGDFGQQEDPDDGEDETTVQKATGGINYDYFFLDPWFVGVFTQFDHDFLQDLVLRTRIGGGPGYRFINTETMELLGRAGVAYINENYRSSSETGDRSFVAAVLSERFRWTISDSQTLLQGIDITPNLGDFGDTLFHFDLTFRQDVAKGFFLDVAFAEDYDTDPAEGREKSDITYGAGLGYRF